MAVNNKTQSFEDLATQVRRTFHRLKAVGDEIHDLGSLSTSHRAVLESLFKGGPQTVPEMARARPVSRQHIQKLVNTLFDEGCVQTSPNPAHKSSPLIELTPKGKRLFERLKTTEKDVLSNLKLPVSQEQLSQTSETLKTICNYFEGPDWLKILEQFKN